MAHPESRYSTLTRTTATTVGFMLLQSRIRSSSNPDIPAPQSPEDTEVNNILGKVQYLYTHATYWGWAKFIENRMLKLIKKEYA